MGGTLSDLLPKTTAKSISDSITNDCVNIVQNIIQNCTTNVNQEQTTNITATGNLTIGQGGSLNIQQSATVDIECALSSSKISDMASQLANYLTNAATANSTPLSLFGGQNTTEVRNNIEANINKSLTQNTQSGSLTKIAQDQITNIKAVNINITDGSLDVGQQLSVVAKTVIDDSSVSDVINKIANTSNSSASTSSGSILPSLPSWVWYILLIILVIISVLIFSFIAPNVISNVFNH
jgi:hypothetical protein